MQGMMLGDSGVSVSDICLGTMTFGNQTSAENAHRRRNYDWVVGKQAVVASTLLAGVCILYALRAAGRL